MLNARLNRRHGMSDQDQARIEGLLLEQERLKRQLSIYEQVLQTADRVISNYKHLFSRLGVIPCSEFKNLEKQVHDVLP